MPSYIIICDRPYQSHVEVSYCEAAINQSEHHVKRRHIIIFFILNVFYRYVKYQKCKTLFLKL